jgi:hypothetical protein
MLPSAVNDTMRDMMAQIRDAGDGIRDGTYTMTAPVITGGSITGAALSGNTFTNPIVSGGSINNTPIGATTASTGAFSTLSVTGATTFSGATVANTFSSSGATITGGAIDGTTIGTTTPSTVKTTALTVTGATSGTLAIEATAVAGTNTATFPAATGTVMVSGNMPAFSAYMGSGQALSAITSTKLQYNTESFDTNSNYDPTTNYRFTPTVAGYYQINACFTGATSTSGDFQISISKNGTSVALSGYNAGASGGFTNSPTTSTLIYLDGSTDYVEVFAYVQSAQTLQSGENRSFSGVLVRTA